MQKLGIIQSRGLGDIVIALPIADYYHKEGWEIHWPICREFIPHMYLAAPWVCWHPVDVDPQGRFFLEEPRRILNQLGVSEELCLYQALTGHPEFSSTAYFQHTKFDEYKYLKAGVPFSRKWQLSDCVTRNTNREQELGAKIRAEIGDRPYVLVHVQGSDHRAEFDTGIIPKDWAAIEITPMTTSMWDWLGVIDDSEAVIMVDSVYSNIVDQMQMKDDGSRYFLPRSHIGLTPVQGCHWHWIDNLRLPQHSRTIRV